jgi:hypothetical protein
LQTTACALFAENLFRGKHEFSVDLVSNDTVYLDSSAEPCVKNNTDNCHS